MSEGKDQLPAKSGHAEVDAFLDQVKQMPAARPAGGRGRLIFALDATASREPTWDRACRIQGEMFEATAALGGLDVKLVYYRGFNECKASRWLASATDLHRVMRAVSCLGGETQIERVLAHAIAENDKQRIGALIFVGDAMEENVDRSSCSTKAITRSPPARFSRWRSCPAAPIYVSTWAAPTG
jgi:hypothetical protein